MSDLNARMNLPPGFDAKQHQAKARKFSNALPTRENCNLDDPQEMFLYMLVALPGTRGGQQTMPSSYNMLVSEALWRRGAMLKCEKCGYMKDPEEVYVPPAADDPHWMTSPGRWMPKDKAPKRDGNPIDRSIEDLTHQQRSALAARMVTMFSPAQLRDLAAKKEAGEL